MLLNQYYAPDEAATAQLLGDLGEALAAAGHEVTAVCSNRSYGDPQRVYPRREILAGVSVVRVGTSGFGRSGVFGRVLDYGFFLVGALVRVALIRNVDVIVSLTTPPLVSLVGNLVARVKGARAILWSMDVYPDLAFALGKIRSKSLLGRVFSFLARTAAKSAHRVVALGESMAGHLTVYGTPVEVVHSWADGDAIAPNPETVRAFREGRGWGDRFIVMYSGNLGLAHEFETVTAGIRRLATERPEILFVFAGVGPRLHAVQSTLSGSKNVEFHGYVSRDRLGASLTAADVHLVTLKPQMPGLVVPSKIYGILAAGRPTVYVGPSAGEVYEIVQEGSCGTALVNGDVDGFVAAISAYWQDRSRVTREGASARALFVARFTKAQALEKLVNILETV